MQQVRPPRPFVVEGEPGHPPSPCLGGLRGICQILGYTVIRRFSVLVNARREGEQLPQRRHRARAAGT